MSTHKTLQFLQNTSCLPCAGRKKNPASCEPGCFDRYRFSNLYQPAQGVDLGRSQDTSKGMLARETLARQTLAKQAILRASADHTILGWIPSEQGKMRDDNRVEH
jgi:hypothetical protein